jgi:GxxExxY protein
MQQEVPKTRSFSKFSEEVIGACIEVHKHLGPGLLEIVYEQALCRELLLRRIPFRRQVELPLSYKDVLLDATLRVDLIVGEHLIVEVKAVAALLAVHKAQLITYLKLSGIDTGLLVNFNVPILVHGLRRVIRAGDHSPRA